jgi:hypothetical protein
MRGAILALAIIAAAALIILNFYMSEKENMIAAEQSIKTTGMFGTVTSVGIIEQSEAIMYEQYRSDPVFEIELSGSGTELSYNGSDGSIKAGYDSFDNQTQVFTLENVGSTTIDVTISAEDFGSPENYIDVGEERTDFQIYVPGFGWKNVPDKSVLDGDGQRDDSELCIAKSLEVGKNVTGFDFRINGTSGVNYTSNYTSFIRVTAYDSAIIGICNNSGSYVSPEKLIWQN